MFLFHTGCDVFVVFLRGYKKWDIILLILFIHCYFCSHIFPPVIIQSLFRLVIFMDLTSLPTRKYHHKWSFSLFVKPSWTMNIHYLKGNNRLNYRNQYHCTLTALVYWNKCISIIRYKPYDITRCVGSTRPDSVTRLTGQRPSAHALCNQPLVNNIYARCKPNSIACFPKKMERNQGIKWTKTNDKSLIPGAGFWASEVTPQGCRSEMHSSPFYGLRYSKCAELHNCVTENGGLTAQCVSSVLQ